MNPVSASDTVHAQLPAMGWRCPICGGGVAPWAQRCPCMPEPVPNVTSAPTNKMEWEPVHVPGQWDYWPHDTGTISVASKGIIVT
jgi:hypothetical protein